MSFFSKKKVVAKQINTLTPEMLNFLLQIPTPILLLEVGGKIKFANTAAAVLLQMDEQKMVGYKVERFGLTWERVQNLINTDPQKVVVDMVTPSAEVVSVCVGARPLADTSLVLLSLEELPMFSKLNADKKFLTRLLNKNPLAITVQNIEGACVWWNDKAQEFFKYTAKDVLGKHLDDFLPKEITSSLQRMNEKIRTKQPLSGPVQLAYKREDGKERILSIYKNVLFSSSNEETLILTSYEDITDRYQQWQDLQRNKTLLQAILDNVPLGLYTRDCEGKMTFFNKQSTLVFNEPDGKKADTPHSYQGQEVVKFHRQREKQILEEGKPIDFPEEVYVDSTGKEHTIHMIKVPLMDAGPKPLVLSIVEDISERRRQEKEVHRVNGFLSAIVQNAPIGLYARNEYGKMLLRNKICNEIFGNVQEEDYDEKGSLPHETEEQVSQYIGREHELLENGKTLDIPEEEYTTATGERKILHLVKVPIMGSTPETRFVVTLVEDITERRSQERTLSETKNTLQSLLDNVPVAIYARSMDDKISFVNRRALELFPGETTYQQEPGFYGEREKSIFRDGKILEFPEEWYTTKRGDKMLLHLIKAPVFDKEGNPFMVLTVAEDITAKKEQERAIVDAKNFLQAVINQLPVSLSVKNYDGKYILWNKKSEELFGVPASEVIGRTSYRTDLNKDQAEFLRESDLRVFESKKEQNIPQELISSAREGIKIMHTVKTPVFNPDGTPNCLLVVSEDITAKTKMEKQIREASDKNTLLVENAREGVVIVEDGKIIYANRAFCHTLGYEQLNELNNQPLLDLVSEDHRLFLKEQYDAVLAGAADSSRAIEVRFTKKNGQKVETEFAAVLSKYLGRRIVMGFIRDVTQANRMLRDMKAERENFRAAFEYNVMPAFILSNKGYISVMNAAARSLFGFTEADKNFYRNIYMRPALTLAVRRKMKNGESAEMDYVVNWDKAQTLFPGRIHKTGTLPLRATLVPINKRDAKDGSIQADYVVYVAHKPVASSLSADSSLSAVLLSPEVLTKETLVLPNSEPYVLCDSNFKIETCNELFCSLCQLQTEELHGQDIRYLFQEDDIPALTQDLHTLQAENTLSNREYALVLGSGLETCRVRLNAMKEADGRYLFILHSLAFHLQIMKILEERSAQLNALLEATNGVVFPVLLENGRLGRIEQSTRALEQKVGFSREELTDMPLRRLFIDPSQKDKSPETVFKQAEQSLAVDGKAEFFLPVRKKDGTSFEAQVVVASLSLPGKEAALVVIQDVATRLDKIATTSKEAQELKSVRETLPGIYMKTDADGRVLEVHSNLDYLDNAAAQKVFLKKTPADFWPAEAASEALFSIKEALGVNVSTQFEFEWTQEDKNHFYEVAVTPINGRPEVVLWIKDASEKRVYDEKIHALYRIVHEPGLTLTEQVDKILEFGCQVFRADIGMVCRFQQGKNRPECVVVYTTPNQLNIERHMEFAVEECLRDVQDGSVQLWTDLDVASCSHCVHKEKHFSSMVAAPLHVGSAVQGALCFASLQPRRTFDPGTEELIGLMAKLLGLRIELRQTGKMLSEASRSLARTLEYVEMPAVYVDLDYQITYANQPFLTVTGRRLENLQGRNFFEECIRNSDLSKQAFKAAKANMSSNLFRVNLDLQQQNGVYADMGWDVFVCKNAEGKADGYALIASSKK